MEDTHQILFGSANSFKNFKFVICDLENLGVQSYVKIVGFAKYYVRHIGSAILNSENPTSSS